MKRPVDVHVGQRVRQRRWMVGIRPSVLERHSACAIGAHKVPTVKRYLTRAEVTTKSGTVRRDKSLIPSGQGDVILVIEDEPDVRDLVVQMLEKLGHRAIEAHDAASARKVLVEGTRVDLVLSDVVLSGGTSGLKFAEQARAAYPDLKIIFMSGYPAEAVMQNGFFGSDQVLLSKPFSRQQLANVVRNALV